MPMNWSAEADARLMATVIQMNDIKLTGAQLQEVAKIMGSECTPKAISHRMTHFRKSAGGGVVKGHPTKGKTVKTGGLISTGKTTTPRADDDRDELADGEKAIDGEDADGLDREIKIEVGEDIGEGLRQAQ